MGGGWWGGGGGVGGWRGEEEMRGSGQMTVYVDELSMVEGEVDGRVGGGGLLMEERLGGNREKRLLGDGEKILEFFVFVSHKELGI